MQLNIVLYTEGLPFTGDTLEKKALGGSESAFIYLSRELARLGHNVLGFCCCSQPGHFDGVEYRDISTFEAWRSQGSCDLFIASRFFQMFMRPINATVKVLWNHDSFNQEQFSFLTQLLPAIDYVYCLSDFHLGYFQQHLPQFHHKLRKSGNGIDLDLANAAVQQQVKKHKIMFTSRPERGLPTAIDIYEQLGDKQLEFVICTYDYPWHQDEIAAIEQACEAKTQALQQQGYPISTNKFTKSDLYKHLAESKVVIHPTAVAEVFCLSAVEAQACRAVYLTSDHSAFQEVVPYQRFDLRDIQAWVTTMQMLLTDEQERQALAEQGWDHVQQYNWTNIAQQFASEAMGHILESSRIKQQSAPVPVSSTQSATEVTAQNNKAKPYHFTSPPKISCLTVTLNRLILLKEAIQCFIDQTYPNKELVIVTDGTDRYKQAITSYVEALNRDDIKLVYLEGAHTLGQLRNISIEAATGDIICQWDDDDLYHPERLRVQAEFMLEAGAGACFMTDQLQYFVKEREMLWTDWSFNGQVQAGIPGTLMMVKTPGFSYPDTATKGEDSVIQDEIARQLSVVNLLHQGHLYVYRYHERNTWSREHHEKLEQFAATTEFINERLQPFLQALSYYPLPKPFAIKTQGGQEAINYNG